MLETTPTLGSIESTLKEKRRFADASLDFNLKNEIFCELFPDVVAEIKEKLAKLRENVTTSSNSNSAAGVAGSKDKKSSDVMSNAAAIGGGGGNGVEDGNGADPNQNTSPWHSFTTNIIFVLLFLIFALIVNHVLKTMNVE